MHLSTATALFGLFTTVLGVLTTEQLVVAIQGVQNSITEADDYAKNVNLVTAATAADNIGNNNDGIAKQLDEIQTSLRGGLTFNANTDGNTLIAGTDPFADALATYFDDLTDRADDFLLPANRATIKDSADEVGGAADDLFDALEVLAKAVAGALEPAALEFDDALEDLDQAYEEDEISKLKVKARAKRASAKKVKARRSNSMRLRY